MKKALAIMVIAVVVGTAAFAEAPEFKISAAAAVRFRLIFRTGSLTTVSLEAWIRLMPLQSVKACMLSLTLLTRN
jgi:hypothetical protein